MSLPQTSSTSANPLAEAGEVTRKHLRGSNLLLFGRLVSLGVNFLTNVLIVRYLSKSDYGAFSYALTIGLAGSSLLLLGMPRAVSRFAPLYQERREYGAMYGSVLLSAGIVATLGLFAVALALVLRAPLVERFVSDPLAQALLLILIGVAPLHALDNLLQSVLAVFAGARAIFFRRYLLGPLLKLGAALGVVALGGNVRLLAWAYLAASFVGVWIYWPMLRGALARADLLRHFRVPELRLPWREVVGFGAPLVAADALVVVRQPIVLMLLESLHGTAAVGDFAAFLKIAGLNLVVLQSMKLLFLPVATRFYARGEHHGVDDLYWKTTIWIALMTFPIFVPCIAMPDTIALLVNGPEYVGSSGVLVALAVGEYANAAFGLNSYTLQVYARVRFLLWTTAVATAASLLFGLLLVPELGALGGAIAFAAALVVQNVLHHFGLHRYTRVELVRREYLRVYLDLAVAVLVLVALDRWLHPHFAVEALLVAGASLALLRRHRATMDLTNVFPELRRFPWLLRLLGVH